MVSTRPFQGRNTGSTPVSATMMCDKSWIQMALPSPRSEERRGGKEGRSRGSPYHLKKKKKEGKMVSTKFPPAPTSASTGSKRERRLLQECLTFHAYSQMEKASRFTQKIETT